MEDLHERDLGEVVRNVQLRFAQIMGGYGPEVDGMTLQFLANAVVAGGRAVYHHYEGGNRAIIATYHRDEWFIRSRVLEELP